MARAVLGTVALGLAVAQFASARVPRPEAPLGDATAPNDPIVFRGARWNDPALRKKAWGSTHEAMGGLAIEPKDDTTGVPGMSVRSAGQGGRASGRTTCMVLAAMLLITSCCITPAAQVLIQKESTSMKTTGGALSAVAVLIALGSTVYLTYWSGTFSAYWAGGMASVGNWCAIACVTAFVTLVFAAVQACFAGAYAAGKVGPIQVASVMSDPHQSDAALRQAR